MFSTFSSFNLIRNMTISVRGINRSMFRSHVPSKVRVFSTTAKNNQYGNISRWLFASAGLVATVVAIGGMTRLTRSGLSIVEWKATGEPFPSTEEGWQIQFEKYKQFPEFALVNSRMTLDEFKFIYFFEWFHRFLARSSGLLYGLPLLGFLAAAKVPPAYRGRLLGLLAVGGGQGFVGWWMVKSGLGEELRETRKDPRVSPYRLCTHLSFAWLLYSGLLYTALDFRRMAKPLLVTPEQIVSAKALVGPLRVAVGMLAITIASGALVAGNDAGRAFNDWPLYAGRLLPEGLWDSSLGVKNFFENTATVQFNHRNNAYLTIGAVGLTHAAIARAKRAAGDAGKNAVHRSVLLGARAAGALVILQAVLGVGALYHYVPVSLGSAHQCSALALWSTVLYALHSAQTIAKGPSETFTKIVQASSAGSTRQAGVGALTIFAASHVLTKSEHFEDF